ncbi:MAG: hypothetical protein K2J01_06730 [Clostridiales bacterium]|nr:hypothetical protein [Clostridiales bacterium]
MPKRRYAPLGQPIRVHVPPTVASLPLGGTWVYFLAAAGGSGVWLVLPEQLVRSFGLTVD